MSSTLFNFALRSMGGWDNGLAQGASLYVRDPATNLLEFIIYSDTAAV